MDCKSLSATIIIGVICFGAFYPITFYFVKNVCCNAGNNCKCDCSSKCKLKGISISIFMLFFISIHGFGLAGVLHCSGFQESVYNRFQTIGSTYFIAQLFILIAFILRLDCSFDGPLTTFKYPKKYIYGMYFAVFITLCCVFGLIGYRNVSGTQNIAILLTIGFLFVFCYLATYITVNIMFWKKILIILTHLKHLCVDETGPRENNNSSNSKDIMIDLVTVGGCIKLLLRYAVSIGISFISTVLVYLILIIYALTAWESSNVTDLSDVLMGLDALINSFCIILLFGFGENVYNLVCKKCDDWIKNKLIDKINKRKKQSISDNGSKNVEKTTRELITLLK